MAKRSFNHVVFCFALLLLLLPLGAAGARRFRALADTDQNVAIMSTGMCNMVGSACSPR